MKENEPDELDQLNYEINETIDKKSSPYIDRKFRYYFYLDFLILELICFLFAFFMYGIKDILGDKNLHLFFEHYWFLPIIASSLILIEMILVYVYYKKIILLNKPCIILCLYFLFLFLFAFLICMCSLISIMTCLFFQGLMILNLIFFIFMNSFKALEDKNIIKLCFLYINTFTTIIIYIIMINKRYVLFFILATSSILYFSYTIHYYKRILLVNFPHLIKNIDESKINLNSLETNNATKSDISLEEENEKINEKDILDKCSISIITKISFIASFFDTFVFNFS